MNAEKFEMASVPDARHQTVPDVSVILTGRDVKREFPWPRRVQKERAALRICIRIGYLISLQVQTWEMKSACKKWRTGCYGLNQCATANRWGL
jgi:hypothetical protein